MANNVHELKRLLCASSVTGLPARNCLVLSDPRTPVEIAVAIDRAASEARDMLLVYYAGHGLLDDHGDLHLGVRESTRAYARFDSFAFDGARSILARSSARKRVLILDCCFSGKAIGLMAADSVQAATAQLDVSGTYTLTATPATKVALAPPGAQFTAFTQELLKVLREGIPGGPELLNMMSIYSSILQGLSAAGYPRPQQRATNMAINFEIARNASWVLEPSAKGASPPLVETELGQAIAERGISSLEAARGAWATPGSVDNTSRQDEMWRRRLIGVIPEAIYDKREMRMLWQTIDLSPADLDWSGPARTVWMRMLHHAEDAGLLKPLLLRVRERAPALSAAVDEALQAWSAQARTEPVSSPASGTPQDYRSRMVAAMAEMQRPVAIEDIARMTGISTHAIRSTIRRDPDLFEESGRSAQGPGRPRRLYRLRAEPRGDFEREVVGTDTRRREGVKRRPTVPASPRPSTTQLSGSARTPANEAAEKPSDASVSQLPTQLVERLGALKGQPPREADTVVNALGFGSLALLRAFGIIEFPDGSDHESGRAVVSSYGLKVIDACADYLEFEGRPAP